MSAIAGIVRLDGLPAERATVEAITHAMASSGPDGMAYWCAGPVALGHCMLRTTHEAQDEIQPLSNERESIVLVFDGRLDNREDLQTEFARQRLPLRTDSDAELVLRAFETWGSKSPEHLLGDFAFAVWDIARQQLFCAVDAMQGAQLYYVKTDRFIAFASFDEALLAVPGVSAEPNEELIAHFLVPTFQSFDPTRSWLKQVSSLKAGQLLAASVNGTYRVDAYWKFEAGEELQLETDAEAEAEFLRIFSTAVKCRLRASGPVGQMLSGGLDSASIWAMTKRLDASARPGGYQTYSAIADEPSDNESKCILSLSNRDAANFVAVPSFTGMVDSTDLVHEGWSHAHPTDNSILLPALMCLAASRNGTRVMLHGASGDVATAVPHKYIAHMMRAGLWKKAWAESRHASLNNNYLRGARPAALYLSNLWTATAPGRLRALTHRVKGDRSLVDSPAINEEFARRMQLAERMATQHAEAASARARGKNMREEQAALLNGRFGVGLGLSGYTRVARRYGMEARDPWGDRRIAEFFMRLPARFKVQEGWTKYLVRKTFAGDLGGEVAWRVGKEHFGFLFTARLMDESRDRVAGAMNHGFGPAAAYLNMGSLRKSVQRLLRNTNPNQDQAAADREFVHDATVLYFMVNRFLAGSGK